MNLKMILAGKRITQIELAKEIGASYSQVSLQMNFHQMLPKKYLDKFCEVLEVSKEDLVKSMAKDGGKNE
jgi:DNA-binding Xre family transcriptional regulator